MKTRILTLLLCLLTVAGVVAKKQEPEKVVVAYVYSADRITPDPTKMTHINYAFAHVSDTFDGVRIDNEARLRSVVALKEKNPELKVLLSIGGWGSGNFSEMASDKKLRKAFAKDCKRVVDEFGLDGIDMDWEYPTQSSSNISSSPDDTKNFTKLIKEIRKAIGKKKLLTMASICTARFVDFKKVAPKLDFINIMAYDMGTAPKLQSALFRSPNSGMCTASEAVDYHLKAGVSADKLVLGIPFYGRGGKKYPDWTTYAKIRKDPSVTEEWDDIAKSPYLMKDGEIVFSFDNPRSIAEKCRYIRDHGLRGAMYWKYAQDNAKGDLRNAVWQGIFGTDNASD